ncbi:MAG: hypothetical protein IJ358_04060 [Clostridia bacterium]|nr:hypothetical protein [Clostridia bacterium]
MINGYMELYGVKGIKNKKYDVINSEDLVHSIAISKCMEVHSMHLSSTEAYVSIVEQLIGQEVYNKFFKVFDDYDALINFILEYQSEQLERDTLQVEIGMTKDLIDATNELIRINRKKVDELLVKGAKGKSEEIDRERKEIEDRLQYQKQELEILLEEENKKNTRIDDLTEDIETLKNLIKERYKGLKESLKAVKARDITALSKFTDIDFEMEVEQDFVDSCLWPEEVYRESDFRKIAQAKFKMMKIEAVYLLDAVDASKELIEEITKANLKKDLPGKMVNRYSTHIGMKKISNLMLTEYDYLFNQSVFNDYYLYIAQLLESSNYGQNWEQGIENVFKAGVDLGIPSRKITKIEHLIGKYSGKVKAEHGYNMQTINPILTGISEMSGGVKVNLENIKKQNNSLGV